MQAASNSAAVDRLLRVFRDINEITVDLHGAHFPVV